MIFIAAARTAGATIGSHTHQHGMDQAGAKALRPSATKNMKTITHWMPAAFCAFISLVALIASVGSPDSGWWRPAFFAFLPMCFFFVGTATAQMHRELRALRQRLIELEQKRAN